MRKADWKKKIKKQTESIGTYRDAFLPVIDTLAGILEQRDRVHADFVKDGSRSVIEYTNKAGATNLSRNPYLVEWESLNAEALKYWKDLGLTPAGLKKLDEDAMKPKKKSAFADLLNG